MCPPDAVLVLGTSTIKNKKATMRPGDSIGPDGRFELEELIAEGGMGTVFRAQDNLLNQKVAVKFLRRDIQQDIRPWERLKREAEILTALRHPGVTAVYAYDLHSECPYLVEEYLVGGDLEVYVCEARRMDPALGKHVLMSLAEILAYIHSHGLLHRDIKPANVFQEEDGRIRLMDFGLARPLDRTRLTQSGGIVGSVAYMPPEVLRGENHIAASDIYQVGLTLHRVLTLRHLHGSSSSIEEFFRSVLAPDWQPEPIGPGLPSDLRGAIEKCCHFDVSERFSNGRELLDYLQSNNDTRTNSLPTPQVRVRRGQREMEASNPTTDLPLQRSAVSPSMEEKRRGSHLLYFALLMILLLLYVPHHRLIWSQKQNKGAPSVPHKRNDELDLYRRLMKQGKEEAILNALLPTVRSIKKLEKVSSPQTFLDLVHLATKKNAHLGHRFAVSLAFAIFTTDDCVYRPLLEKHFNGYSSRERLMATIRVYLDGLLTSNKLLHKGKEFKRYLTSLQQRASRFGFLSGEEERTRLEHAILALDYANWCHTREFVGVGWPHIEAFVLQKGVPLCFYDDDCARSIFTMAEKEQDFASIARAAREILFSGWFPPKDRQKQQALHNLKALHCASLAQSFTREPWMKHDNQLTKKDEKTLQTIETQLRDVGHDMQERWLTELSVPIRLSFIGAGGLDYLSQFDKAWQLYRPVLRRSLKQSSSLRGLLRRGHRLAIRAEEADELIDELQKMVKGASHPDRRAILRCQLVGTIVAKRYGDLPIGQFDKVTDKELASVIGKSKAYGSLGFRGKGPPLALGTVARLFAPLTSVSSASEAISTRLLKNGDELCEVSIVLEDSLWMVLLACRKLNDTSTLGLWFDTLVASHRWDRPRLLRTSELMALRCQAHLFAAQAREPHEEKRANLVTRVRKATDTLIDLMRQNFDKARTNRLQDELLRVYYLLKKDMTPLPHSLLGPSIVEAHRYLQSLPLESRQRRFEVAYAIIRAFRPGSDDLQTHKACLDALKTLHSLEDCDEVTLADRIRALPSRIAARKAINDPQWASLALAMMHRFQVWQLPTSRRWQQPYYLAQALFDSSFQLNEKEIYRLLVKAEREPLAPLATIRSGVDAMVDQTNGLFRKGLARAKGR